MNRIIGIALVVFAATSPNALSAAGLGQSEAGSIGRFGSPAPTGDRQPFKNLFPSPIQPRSEQPQKPLFQVRPVPRVQTSSARVVCGMTVVSVDPAFDQAIRRPIPNTAPKSVIQLVPPPACESGVSGSERPQRP